MSKETVFTDTNFDELTGQGLALVDFWAPWCGPCRMQGPIVEKLAETFAGPDVTVGKMNVDEHKGVAARFGVRAIPTLILLKDGQEVQRFQGLQSQDALSAAMNQALSN